MQDVMGTSWGSEDPQQFERAQDAGSTIDAYIKTREAGRQEQG